MISSIHILTGNGKDKTATALGLALRATGECKKVFIAQFAKELQCFEIETIKKFIPAILVKQYDLNQFSINTQIQKQIDDKQSILAEIKEKIISNEFDVVIIDELCNATSSNLFTINEFLNILKLTLGKKEIIITGSYVPAELIENTSMITEITEIKLNEG